MVTHTAAWFTNIKVKDEINEAEEKQEKHKKSSDVDTHAPITPCSGPCCANYCICGSLKAAGHLGSPLLIRTNTFTRAHTGDVPPFTISAGSGVLFQQPQAQWVMPP